MKKFIAILTAVMMIMALIATPVFAADEKGSITINGASAGNTYSIYLLLDLESYDTTKGAYSYKVNSNWTDFFKEGTGALDYVAIDATGYVTWTASGADSVVAEFAKLALAYAKANGISAQNTKDPNDGETSIKFENLTLGYYLIDSTMGALCGLTTTNPNASISAKNGAPIIEKQVKEDLTNQWGTQSTADIGQTIEYRVTINVHQGAQNYVLHDTMEQGITFSNDVTVTHIVSATEASETAIAGTDYEVVTDGITDGCTFEIRFTESFCDHLATNDKVVVQYTGKLDQDAVIAGEGNKNSAKLSFGDDHETAVSTVTTLTFAADIVKTDDQNKLIDGAEFKLYDANNNLIKLVKVNEDLYRLHDGMETSEIADTIVVKDGKIRVAGLDNGTYYLEEVVAPSGYNKLTAAQPFTISDANLDAKFNDGVFSVGSCVQVVNKTGSMLPETGGIGTTLFVTFGGLTVLAAGVVLFAKKRMSQIEE